MTDITSQKAQQPARNDAATEASDNPLLDFPGLPRFAAFDPSQVAPALDVLIAQAREALDRVTDESVPLTWDDFVEPLDEATERLGRAWGIVGHLNSVADTPALREAYNANLPRVTQFWTELSQHEALFSRYKAFAAQPEFAQLPAPRRRTVENALRDFRLGGAELVSPARERFAEIQERHAALSQKFSENVLDATNAFALCIDDESRLDGLPSDAREAAREAAQADGREGWKFTLQFPSYLPVMQYADDRSLREAVYRAYTTRASELAAAPADADQRAALDNASVIDELLALRGEEAGLLGYANFAEVSLVSKMADSPQQVIEFLRDLAQRARPFAERDLKELREFASRELGLAELQAWDLAWVGEKLKEARYSFSDQTVKQYFQLPRVLEGLFGLVGRMFTVDIVPDEAEAWHPDVRFFRIERDGALLGQFWLDLYARASKRPGAWMDDARGRRRRGADVQTPAAYLVCNFQPPVGGRPALLTHDDVTTLFHEFGHGLHHLLTRIEDAGVAGISGVEWDAVELPSQFMENFCWEWDNVRAMSAHVETGEPLPRELFDRMLAAKNFQSGMQTLRQIEFSLFDMRLHSEYRPVGERPGRESPGRGVQALLDEVRREVAVVIPPAWNRFQNSFAHIFAGGYSAGYYSYKWAEVLSADAYAAFEEAMAGPEPAQAVSDTGRRFLDEILSVGGSRPAIDSFRAFRGRDPQLDALLRHNGMVEASVAESHA
ncbi:MAG TPA: M3 family metallopeptidase [Burkholderiaceae bacterium]|nr:M3 family metallopeptidase [Burkholderiaceae bacterium]